MESGVIGLFRTAAIIIIVYYVVRFIFSKFFKNLNNSTFKDNVKSKPVKKEDRLGDYVDYEDLSD